METTLGFVVFWVLAVFISVFSVLTVTTRRIVRSATYLLLYFSARREYTSNSDIRFSVPCK